MLGVTKERDPFFLELEKNVFSDFKNISDQEDILLNITPQSSQNNFLQVQPLSLENAIKELISMHKQGII